VVRKQRAVGRKTNADRNAAGEPDTGTGVDGLVLARQDSPQQHGIDAAAESLAPGQNDDRNAESVAGREFRIALDIYLFRAKAMLDQDELGIVAKVTAAARI
jgi:hypothetical protein